MKVCTLRSAESRYGMREVSHGKIDVKEIAEQDIRKKVCTLSSAESRYGMREVSHGKIDAKDSAEQRFTRPSTLYCTPRALILKNTTHLTIDAESISNCISYPSEF